MQMKITLTEIVSLKNQIEKLADEYEDDAAETPDYSIIEDSLSRAAGLREVMYVLEDFIDEKKTND